METKVDGISQYISFWPGNCDTKICCQKESHYHTFEIDKVYEGRPPSSIFILKSLDVKKINIWFETHKNKLSWVLRGSSPLQGPNEFNCAGLTYRLLEEGGIQEKIPNRLMLSIKKNIGITALFSLTLISSYYWSKRTIEPLFQSVDSARQLGSSIRLLNERILYLIHDTLIVYPNRLFPVISSLSQVCQLELDDYPSLLRQLNGVSEDLNQLVENETFTTMISHFIKIISQFKHNEKIDTIDDAVTKNSVAINLSNSLSKVQHLTQELNDSLFSPFRSPYGVVVVGVLALSAAFLVLTRKIAVDAMTPTELEALVSDIFEKEENQSHKEGYSFQSIIKLSLSALGVGFIGYRFFKSFT